MHSLRFSEALSEQQELWLWGEGVGTVPLCHHLTLTKVFLPSLGLRVHVQPVLHRRHRVLRNLGRGELRRAKCCTRTEGPAHGGLTRGPRSSALPGSALPCEPGGPVSLRASDPSLSVRPWPTSLQSDFPLPVHLGGTPLHTLFSKTPGPLELP